ncbi:NYN domain-containing protein [Candidatus Falkowbacteria bacterium]|nr:NYN domain-containing protein [Candidatus Falkowbacteria bacterium]
MTERKEVKVAIFVDGPNLYHMTKNLGYRINFKELIYTLCNEEGVYPTILEYFYDFNPKKPLTDGFNQFLGMLKSLSFNIIPVELKSYYGKNQYKDFKSRTDSAINFRVGKYLAQNIFDTIILISGDSDFEYLTKECKNAGKQVIIIAITEQIANNLYNYADMVLCLDKLNQKGRKLLLPIPERHDEADEFPQENTR